MKNDLSYHNLSVEDATELALDWTDHSVEVIGSKQSYAANWWKPNNDDNDTSFGNRGTDIVDFEPSLISF